MADTFTVVFDACVLYPFALRDLLVQLATTDLFRGRWSASIHDEWMDALVAQNPRIERRQLQRTRELMDEHVLDSVVTGYEPLIAGLTLPDPQDRHVLAVAIRCGAHDRHQESQAFSRECSWSAGNRGAVSGRLCVVPL